MVARGGTTDTRIFSEQISRSSMTQDNPRARFTVISWSVRLPLVALGNRKLGTKAGTNQFL